MNVLVPVLQVLLVALSLAPSPSQSMLSYRRCISPPCDYPTLDVDGFFSDGNVYTARYARNIRGRSLVGLLEGLAPVAAATSGLLAGVADLGYAAGNPYYFNPWYGGYGGGYAPGYGYGYPYPPYRPFPYYL